MATAHHQTDNSIHFLLLSKLPSVSFTLWQKETRTLLQRTAQKLWQIPALDSAEDTKNFSFFFAQVIIDLEGSLREYKSNSIEKGYANDYKSFIQTELFNKAKNSFQQAFFAFFDFHFALSSNIYCKDLFILDLEEEEELEEPTETKETISMRENSLAAACYSLNELHLLQVCEPILTKVCCNQIQRLINTHCRSGESFESGRLQQVHEWLNEFAFKWLKNVFRPLSSEQSFPALFCSLCTRLEFFAHESFANLRISELFDIIIDFPDSIPALHDLRDCLIKTNQLSHLIRSLNQAFQKRLLHPGANTTDIIIQFINTIKALQVLDPTILSMDVLSQPIRNYLQKREDTIRCAVKMFTNESSELYQELTDVTNGSDNSSNNPDNWEPLAAHSLITSSPASVTSRDTFSHLVHIFGSKDLFVAEYRNMLAERLLNITDYRVEHEMRIIELLKLRFGDQTLQHCDIMIKDVANAKRMNKLIHDDDENSASFLSSEFQSIQAMIISHLFWPSFREDSLILPAPVRKLFEDFHNGYRKIKRDRKLEWVPFLGSVDIELEIYGEQKEFTVNPFQATILYYFQEKSKWNLTDLGEVMGVNSDELKRKIGFWVGNGILQHEENNVYRLRQQGDEEPISTTVLEEEGGVESSLTSAEEEKESMWALCFNFINACLTNQGPMPIDRIHFMLSSLMREDYRATQAELRVFLEQKIKVDQLEKEDNLYKSKE